MSLKNYVQNMSPGVWCIILDTRCRVQASTFNAYRALYCDLIPFTETGQIVIHIITVEISM